MSKTSIAKMNYQELEDEITKLKRQKVRIQERIDLLYKLKKIESMSSDQKEDIKKDQDQTTDTKPTEPQKFF